MSNAHKEITRDDLYKEIWQSPMSKLAAKWGVPIAGIAKACRKMNVPRPESGYWQLVKRGWQVEHEPLTAATATTLNKAFIKPAQKRTQLGGSTQSVKNESTTKVQKVQIPKNLDDAHRLVKQTRKALTQKTRLDQGFVRATYDSGNECPLDVKVTPEQVDRTLRILDAIIKAVVNLGGHFERRPEQWRLRLFMGKQPVAFGVTEARKRINREFTPEEREAKGFWLRDKYDWERTGLLRFRIYGGDDLYEMKSEETKAKPLEDTVPEIIECLAGVEAEAERTRFDKLEYKREEDERRVKEAIECRKQQEEEERRNLLEKMAKEWMRARQLRCFIRECERVLLKSWGEIPAAARAMEWLRWAREHADRIDPLTPGGYLRNLERKKDPDIKVP